MNKHLLGLVSADLDARSTRGRRRRGVTLFEVMIVIALILLLMGVTMGIVMNGLAQGQAGAAAAQMNAIAQQVQIYKVRKRKAPKSLQDLYSGQDAPVDPWGAEFVYQSPGPDGRDFEIISYGADGREGGTGANSDIRYSEIGN